MKKAKAFQDYFPENACFGCGPYNTRGLHIKSFWRDETKKEAVSRWQPKKYHSARRRDVVHGGNIASVIDCHAIWTATAWAYHLENRGFASEPIIEYVTGELNVKYIRKTPLKAESIVVIKTDDIKVDDKKMILYAKLFVDGLLCSTGKITAVRVDYEF